MKEKLYRLLPLVLGTLLSPLGEKAAITRLSGAFTGTSLGREPLTRPALQQSLCR